MDFVSISQSNFGISFGSTSYSSQSIRQSRTSRESANPLSVQHSDEDKITLSKEGRSKSQDALQTEQSPAKKETPPANKEAALDPQQLKELQTLQTRDKEVRAHEKAHLAAAGQYAKGGASFSFKKGPDGNSYAVGGEVGIDVGKEQSPEATIAKMQIVKRAALAPATPSSADRKIAAQAVIKEADANKELLTKRQQELGEPEKRTNPMEKDEKEDVPSTEKMSSSLNSSPGTLRTMITAYQNAASF